MVKAAEVVASPLTYGGMVGAQVYRYVRVYDPVQRQQTKWLVFAFGVAISLFLIYVVPGTVVPSLSAADPWYPLLPISLLSLALLPLRLRIAILRHRLRDIDVIINRTLVYGSLIALLVTLYFGLILALQALVRAVTGSLSQQPLVIVGSPPLIAALFQPLHRRLQASIDCRFYRHKFDAAKVVAAFSATPRQEVDLDELREQVLANELVLMEACRVCRHVEKLASHPSMGMEYKQIFRERLHPLHTLKHGLPTL